MYRLGQSLSKTHERGGMGESQAYGAWIKQRLNRAGGSDQTRSENLGKIWKFQKNRFLAVSDAPPIDLLYNAGGAVTVK